MLESCRDRHFFLLKIQAAATHNAINGDVETAFSVFAPKE
ncbi:hypothetical protein PSE_3081 [Pseudovibrio sp. FO-BEG1]|nr:hypothetical protein PSE_3081 [Pseudovibrio sp. FO-BEG1]